MERQLQGNGYTVGFSNKEVTAWGGIALMKQMLDRLQFQEAFSQFGIPEPLSNRDYAPRQLIEQFIVSIWCGACRFAHAEIVRLDNVLCRLITLDLDSTVVTRNGQQERAIGDSR